MSVSLPNLFGSAENRVSANFLGGKECRFEPNIHINSLLLSFFTQVVSDKQNGLHNKNKGYNHFFLLLICLNKYENTFIKNCMKYKEKENS